MELDELKASWQELDRKLETSIALNLRLLQGRMAGKAETTLKRLAWLLGLEVLINVAGLALVGSFIGNHFTEIRYLVPAVALDLGLIALVIAGVRQIAAINLIDYCAPIVAIQRRLESLRMERIRTVKWTLLLAPLAWTPLFIVGLKGLFDIDVYANFGIAYVPANLACGAAVVVAGVWASRRFAARLEGSSVMRWVADCLAGTSLKSAARFLDSLSQFEEEGRRPVGH
jgi:hypothetical protein